MAKLHQGDYVRKLLKKYDMENPRETPTEANFMRQARARILSNPDRELLGMESEYQEQCHWGELAWLLKTREDLCFFVGMGARFLRCAAPVEMGWLKRVLRYLAHFPEKGRMIIPGKKLYLHGR